MGLGSRRFRFLKVLSRCQSDPQQPRSQKTVTPLSPAWAEFDRLQQAVENENFATADALADDAALTDLVGEFEAGEPSTDEIARRYYSLRLNRRRKHRVRRRLFKNFVARPAEIRKREENPTQSVDDADQLAWVRRRVTEPEWRLLLQRAAGEDSANLAKAAGISRGAFRTRAHRLRQRLQAVA